MECRESTKFRRRKEGYQEGRARRHGESPGIAGGFAVALRYSAAWLR